MLSNFNKYYKRLKNRRIHTVGFYFNITQLILKCSIKEIILTESYKKTVTKLIIKTIYGLFKQIQHI